MGVGQGAAGGLKTSPIAQVPRKVLAGTTRNASGSDVGNSSHRALSVLEMVSGQLVCHPRERLGTHPCCSGDDIRLVS